MSHNVHGTYVSEKINKIRWRPDFMNDSHYFLTGSWDNDQNSVKLWDFQENEEDADVYPYLVTEYGHKGDVTEIKFLNADYFITSSSFGSVYLMRIISSHGVEPVIESKITWGDIHNFKNGEVCPCTGVSVYENDIATVGEDGCINLLNSQNKAVIRKINNADSCSLHCVSFLKHNEILTSNLRGQMQIWDLRSGQNKPMMTFMLSGEQIMPTCIEFHPTQRHLIVAGDEEGSLTAWDLRQSTFPINLLSAHENSVSEIRFHPDHSDQLFSCSNAGDVWHWFPKSSPSGLSEGVEGSVWLASEAVKNKLEVLTLMPKLYMPINSLDLNRNKVLCGCDNEAVYLINGVKLFN